MDLISRARLANKIGDWFNNINYHPENGADPFTIAMLETENEMIAAVIQEIEDAPTVDAEPVRHAKWIGGELGYCSACKHRGCASDIWSDVNGDGYCPNCGARMDKEETEK